MRGDQLSTLMPTREPETTYWVTVRFTVNVAVGGLAPAALTFTTAE
jgi:hypothetical protein